MRRRMKICACTVVLLAVGAAADVGGVVVGASGRPIAGAVVELVGGGRTDTTDSDGRFAIVSGAMRVRGMAVPGEASMDEGVLRFSLERSGPVQVEVNDLEGRRVRRLELGTLAPGSHSVDVLGESEGSGRILVVRLVRNGMSTLLRTLPARRKIGAVAAARASEATTDSIRAWKAGWVPVALAVSVGALDLRVRLDSDTVAGRIGTLPGKVAFLPSRFVSAGQSRGYAEYVPPDYVRSSGWPLVVYFDGDGGMGDGKTETVLKRMVGSGMMAMVNQDKWDSAHRFVVMSPQFLNYDDRSAANVDAFLQFAKAYYRIDTNRIYLASVSGGGAALGDYLYAKKGGVAAAVLAVSCYLPPIDNVGNSWGQVPAWFLLGAADNTVGVDGVAAEYFDLASSTKTKVAPRMTLYTGVGHSPNSYSRTFSPASMANPVETTYKYQGQTIALSPYSNVYDWLLSYRLGR